MAATPIYALPYPVTTDPADVPADIKRLADRVEVVLPIAPGTPLDHKDFTAAVTVTVTTEAAATVIVTANAVTLDGSTPILVDFFAHNLVAPAAVGAGLTLYLFMDGASLGTFGAVATPVAGNLAAPARCTRRLVPASGSHTFSVRAAVTSSTGFVNAGPGGVGNLSPGFIRITRA